MWKTVELEVAVMYVCHTHTALEELLILRQEAFPSQGCAASSAHQHVWEELSRPSQSV